MVAEPILIKEATVEDVPFLQAMIWEALLASPIFVAHYGVETLQHLEEEYWSRWDVQSDPAFVALDASGQKRADPFQTPTQVKTSRGLSCSVVSFRQNRTDRPITVQTHTGCHR